MPEPEHLTERMLAFEHAIPPLPPGTPRDIARETSALTALCLAASRGFEDATSLVVQVGGDTRWIARRLLALAADALHEDHARAALLSRLGMSSADRACDRLCYCHNLLIFAGARLIADKIDDARDAWQLALANLEPGHKTERALCFQNLAGVALLRQDWEAATTLYEHFLITWSSKMIDIQRNLVADILLRCYVETEDKIGMLMMGILKGITPIEPICHSLGMSGAMAMSARLSYFGYGEHAERIRQLWMQMDDAKDK